MPHEITSVTRLFLHSAFVPAGRQVQNPTFWAQFNGMQFRGNIINNASTQIVTNYTHIERDENGEPLRQRQKIG